MSYLVQRGQEPDSTGLELIARAVQQRMDTSQMAAAAQFFVT